MKLQFYSTSMIAAVQYHGSLPIYILPPLIRLTLLRSPISFLPNYVLGDPTTRVVEFLANRSNCLFLHNSAQPLPAGFPSVLYGSMGAVQAEIRAAYEGSNERLVRENELPYFVATNEFQAVV